VADDRVVLAVDPDRFAEVVAVLRRAGLVVEAEWPATGTLAGRLDARLLPVVRGLDGVEAVEPERTVRLPPPGSPLE
jgi:hypothetical protein